ncbi:MAG: hypothetical protein ACYCWW_12235, partial [Deltaproteobacteria bacterium]
LHVKTAFGPLGEEWDATLSAFEPTQHLAWQGTLAGDPSLDVRLAAIGPARCRMIVRLSLPGAGRREVETRLQADLARFKRFLEARGEATGAWHATAGGD